MDVSWGLALDGALLPVREERLFELYHENSKLSAESAADLSPGTSTSPFALYLASRGFKQLRGAPRTALPDARKRRTGLSETLRRRRSARELSTPLPLGDLSTLLAEAFEPTAIVRSEERAVEQPLRPWPSAGGLYPLDVYVVAGSISGLQPGVYHHNVLTHELERLRAPEPKTVLRDGFFWQDFIVDAAAVIVLAAVFDRSVAKYGERGYRLTLLDAGHAAQNVLLVAEDLGLPAVAVGGFCDDALAAALDLDGRAEAPLHTVVVGGADG